MKTINSKNQQAFTLIEVMVVISIIAIITSIVYASFGTVKAQARDTKRVADSVQMRTALTSYSLDHNGVPSAASTTASGCSETSTSPQVWTCSTASGLSSILAPLVAGGYISTIPTDPLNTSGYSYYYSTGPSTSVDPKTGTPLAPSASFDYVSETQTTSPSSPVILGINVGTPDYTNYPGSGYPSNVGQGSQGSGGGDGDNNPPPSITEVTDGARQNDYNWFVSDGISITGTNLGGNVSVELISLNTGDQTNVPLIDDSGTSIYFYVPSVDTDREGTAFEFELTNDDGATTPINVTVTND